MRGSCRTFRADLARVLSATSSEAQLRLGWHEHLLGCAPCRDLLEAEQALDQLMESLPAPRLPADLARRVLERLERSRRGSELERLLASDPDPRVPSDLPDRILSGLRGERVAARLDALLDSVPTPEPPPGLAPRLLARLEAERGSSAGAVPRSRRRVVRLAVALAAALVLALGFAWLRAGRGPGTGQAALSASLAQDPRDDEEVERELLAALDLLENWEELTGDDLDLLLVETEPIDWALLEYGAGTSSEPSGPDPLREEG